MNLVEFSKSVGVVSKLTSFEGSDADYYRVGYADNPRYGSVLRPAQKGFLGIGKKPAVHDKQQYVEIWERTDRKTKKKTIHAGDAWARNNRPTYSGKYKRFKADKSVVDAIAKRRDNDSAVAAGVSGGLVATGAVANTGSKKLSATARKHRLQSEKHLTEAHKWNGYKVFEPGEEVRPGKGWWPGEPHMKRAVRSARKASRFSAASRYADLGGKAVMLSAVPIAAVGGMHALRKKRNNV